MINETSINSCNEFYVIEKTIEVIVGSAEKSKTIRIEALLSLPQREYSTHVYIKEHVTVQPTFPRTGEGFDRKPANMQVWINYDLPWTNGETADEVINKTLAFLLSSHGESATE